MLYVNEVDFVRNLADSKSVSVVVRRGPLRRLVVHEYCCCPKAWLDWSQVLAARARAVREYERRKDDGDAGARKRLFDAALLTWLTTVPPDRVGVARKLQLGGTLKPTAAGFELDLRTADAHKTAALFGYSSGRAPPP